MKRVRRLLMLVGIVLVVLVAVAFFFISPITKYLIEKYDVQYTGREITIGKLFLNFFTGSATIDNFVLYEKDGKTPFFKATKLETRIVLKKILAGTYDVTKVESVNPSVTIIQSGNHFNYDDLVSTIAGDTKDTVAKKDDGPLHLLIRNIDISNFAVTYINKRPYNKIAINKGYVRIPLIAWNDPQLKVDAGFSFATGGVLDTKTNYNEKSGAYNTAVSLKDFNLTMLYPYLKDYMKVKSLDGMLTTKINVKGNANNPEQIAANGSLALRNMSIVDNIGEKLIACESTEVLVDSINTEKNLYDLKTITLNKPYVKFAMYDDGFNYERIMTTPTETTGAAVDETTYANVFLMIADYTQDIVKEYVVSNYNADQFLVKGGKMVFTDYTMEDKFQYELDNMNMLSDKINSNNSRIALEVNSTLNRSGKLTGSLYLNPDDLKDMDFNATVSDITVADFNPYSKHFVATPFLSGQAFYTNKTSIHNRKLDNKNDLVVYKVKAGKKVKNKTAMNIPVRLAVSLLKDVKGNIKLSIPVTGSLDDPKFKWGKIVWQVLKNLLVKAATAPFRLLAGKFGGGESDYKEILFDYAQTDFTAKQTAQADKLASMMQKEPDIKLELIQLVNKEDETEYVGVDQAKRAYLKFSDTATLSPEQQKAMKALPIKDSAFNAFLETKTGQLRLQSTQDKCIAFIGKERVAAIVAGRESYRKQYITNYFVKEKGISADRLMFTEPKDQTPLSRNEPPKFLINVAVKEE